MKVHFGNLFMRLSLLITTALFVMSKSDITIFTSQPLLSLAQFAGLLGAISYSYTIILSSRAPMLEYLFGGLDKVYKIHQRMGRVSFILLSIHVLSLLFRYANVPDVLRILLFPSMQWEYTFGIIAFWTMAGILALVIFAKLEYQAFVRVQTFFIVSFFFGFLHAYTISSDISWNNPLRLFVLSHILLGMLAFIYRKILYYRIGPRYEYTVSTIGTLPNGWRAISFLPKGKRMPYVSGQFVYIGFARHEYKKESHPFSIVSNENDEHITLWIKPVGDFTQELSQVQVGDDAILYGPYGEMPDHVYGKKHIICIAGGIGITPFIGMLQDKVVKIPNATFTLFYSVRSIKELEGTELETRLPHTALNFSYVVRTTESEPRLTAKEVLEIAGDITDSIFLLCGPVPMMESMKQQLYDAGIKPRTVIYEEFAF